MTIKSHNIIALCVLALACTTAAFAQETEMPQQENYPQDQHEPPQQQVIQQQVPQQYPQQYPQNPQQPVYYAVPQPTNNVQYIVVPQSQYQAQNQQGYMPPPQPQQPVAVPPVTPRQGKACFFMGVNMDFYASTLSFESDNHYVNYLSNTYYDDDYRVNHEYDGKGISMELLLGVLIKDMVGIRGIIGIGEQEGESSYSGSKEQCSKEYCINTDTELADFSFGVAMAVFPFNQASNVMYNSYVEGAVGFALHSFEDDLADDFDHSMSATLYMKVEIGKLFHIGEAWNVGVGMAYSYNFEYDDYDEYQHEEERHTFWVGVRFVRKRNYF